jgi:hypothetical protein
MNKALLEHSYTTTPIYELAVAIFAICQQSGIVAIEIIWPPKLKIVTIWCLTEKIQARLSFA